jgi:NAD(P)-dependent dehydrogenase (short-subunit alcohol dehydrogenase family)
MGVLDRFDLRGKVAVVTGGNRGLGEAWVQSLVDVGATVVIAARDDERSHAVAERFGDRVDVVGLDVRDTAGWRCSQAFGGHMVANGGGVIVNIGSISAQIVNRPQWQPAYNASKAAVHQLTKSLAAEWAPYGVRVNALAPGYTKTDMAPVDRPEFRARWIEDAPMQRYATPDEYGAALVFLASDASSFMTGSTLVVDGGYTVF